MAVCDYLLCCLYQDFFVAIVNGLSDHCVYNELSVFRLYIFEVDLQVRHQGRFLSLVASSLLNHAQVKVASNKGDLHPVLELAIQLHRV